MPISTKAGDDFMTSVLVGVIKGSDTKQLKVDGIDGRTTAYSQGEMVYVRTPYTMLSPAWVKSVQSGDGTKVYALNSTPVILLSDKGKMVRAYLTPKETSDEQY
jgi:intracellular multiplication protein IcmK